MRTPCDLGDVLVSCSRWWGQRLQAKLNNALFFLQAFRISRYRSTFGFAFRPYGIHCSDKTTVDAERDEEDFLDRERQRDAVCGDGKSVGERLADVMCRGYG